jgi:hypothetical protein
MPRVGKERRKRGKRGEVDYVYNITFQPQKFGFLLRNLPNLSKS